VYEGGEEPKRKSGCGIAAGLGVLALVCLVGALVATAVLVARNEVRRVAEIKQRGSDAVLKLAADGEKMLAEYADLKASKPAEKWQVRAIGIGRLDPEGKLRIEEALVLCGDVLIASSSPNPRRLVGRSVAAPTQGVEIMRGRHGKRGPKGAGLVECLQFKAPFQVKGRKGTARLIIRLEP
jgi:hypothetical protein